MTTVDPGSMRFEAGLAAAAALVLIGVGGCKGSGGGVRSGEAPTRGVRETPESAPGSKSSRDRESQPRSRGARAVGVPSIHPSDDGEGLDPREATHFALLIGTNKYESKKWCCLNNPKNDVGMLADTLEEHYLFETRVMKDPTWAEVDKAIGDLIEDDRWDATNHDQLLVYVAGHGYKPPQEKGGRGNAYLILNDSPPPENLRKLRRQGYQHQQFVTDLAAIPAEHTLVMLDVCFGGEFFESNERTSRGVYQAMGALSLIEEKWERSPTRMWITAGGDEYVSDGPKGQNSPFARSLLRTLENPRQKPTEVVTTNEIFSGLEKIGPGAHRGTFGRHTTGAGFVFVRKSLFQSRQRSRGERVAALKGDAGTKTRGASGGGRAEKCGDGEWRTYSGRCCPYGKSWNGEKCVGESRSCPPGWVLNVRDECVRSQCSGERVRASDGVHCCWPGQAYHVMQGECVGTPRKCPTDMRPEANTCARVRPEGYVRIEAGTYEMGASYKQAKRRKDAPEQRVRITRPFWMKETEVTQKEWSDLMGTSPSYFDECGPNCPVERVSWYDAVAYVNKRSEKEKLETCYELKNCSGKVGTACPASEDYPSECRAGFQCETVEFEGLDCNGYRLPTEAEWEYAARAGTKRYRYGRLENIAWVEKTADERPHPVGELRANRWRLSDMLGNVWEWTTDYYHETPQRAKKDREVIEDPIDLRPTAFRVGRGGAWNRPAHRAMAAYRGRIRPRRRHYNTGFRPVRTVPGNQRGGKSSESDR